MGDIKPPAIFFHSDAIESDGKDLVGRRSAGQSFLTAWLDHAPGDVVHALVQTGAAADQFDKTARALRCTRDLSVATIRGGRGLDRIGSAFLPGPGFLDAAYVRRRIGADAFSLIGITHTMSTRRVIEGLHKTLHEPVEPWDAIICTSRAVHDVVATQLAQEAEYARDRYGATRVPQPQLPIIPLGIHSADFAQTPADRVAMRARFNTPEDAIVVMTMGRLTSVEKANPAPLYIALEQVAAALDRRLHLWMVGWSRSDAELTLHKKGAAQLAPSVTLNLIDGRKSDLRRHVWAGADIFTLPVDNIQETFGLVPVEAMAAGLPVVMPDWNGFRDTVKHEETGFLIPTRFNRPGSLGGAAMAARYADGTDDYLRFLSLMQHQTVIDVPAYRDALLALAKSDALRRRMGQAGQAHVRAHFDWSAVMPQYIALHEELAAQRATAGRQAVGGLPTEIDPFTLYQGYPSHSLSDDDQVTLRAGVDVAALNAIDAVNGRALYKRRVIPNADLADFAALLTPGTPRSVADLTQTSPLRPEAVRAAILFLAKYDFVTLVPQGPK